MKYSTIYVPVEKEYHCSCLKCYNSSMAEYSDTDFEHVELDPIILKDFGRMLMTYEGFNFKLEIFDRSNEIP